MRRQRPQRNRNNKETSANFPGFNNNRIVTSGIDINTNLGEGFGAYRVPGESELLPYVTSANIACGAHAGDPLVMENALEELRYYGLALGAHIGYPDLAGFGRREIHLSTSELRATILFQLSTLAGMAKTMGFEVSQVRPHGFLYRQMAHDLRIATVVARAIYEFDRWLVLLGPAGSILLSAGEKAGIRVAGEAWLDRTYDSNGVLLPHSHNRAAIKSQQEVINQAHNLITRKEVVSADGTRIKIDFQSIHVHSGMPNAKSIAEFLHSVIPQVAALTAEPFAVGQREAAELAYGSF